MHVRTLDEYPGQRSEDTAGSLSSFLSPASLRTQDTVEQLELLSKPLLWVSVLQRNLKLIEQASKLAAHYLLA